MNEISQNERTRVGQCFIKKKREEGFQLEHGAARRRGEGKAPGEFLPGSGIN